ncbi:hypothetical protein MW887_004287 [Aspergillus wentii]|nr:hypothetical protein MW887_004287 [Aspergillus wentii]
MASSNSSTTSPASSLLSTGRDEEQGKSVEKDVKKPKDPPAWTPLALSCWVFIAIALLFVALFIVIEVLFQYSNQNHGLSTNSSTNHYLWTYGTTAVFMLISAIWKQIDHRTKQLAPWAALHSKPDIARKTVLLDYISPWNVVAMFRAGRNPHWPVVMAIIGTLVLQLVAVASTSLLTLETVFLSHIDTTPFSQSTFNLSNYNNIQQDGVPQFITVAIGWKGLDYPVGTTAEHAFQPFNVSSDVKTSTNSLITAEVDVFTPDLDCEVWEVVHHNLSCFNTPCNSKDVNLTISTKSCVGYLQTQIFASDTTGLSYLANVKHVTVPALRGNLDCLPMVSQSLTFDPEDFIPDGDFAEGCERYGTIYTPENAHIGGYFGMYDSTQLKDETCSRVVLNFGYLLDDNSTHQINSYACNTTIDILDVNVTFSLPDYTIITADPIESSRQQFIPHYEPYEDNFMYMLPVRNDTSKGYDQFWSAVMEGNNVTTTDLTEQPLKVVDAATRTFRILLAQTLSSYSRIPSDNIHDALPGTIDTHPFTLSGTLTNPNVTRLKQSAISTRILEGLLAGMVVSCAVAFYFLRSRDILPLSPCSIATAASYLVPFQLVGEGLVPPGAEFQRKSELIGNSGLAGLMLSMGWWKMGDAERKRVRMENRFDFKPPLVRHDPSAILGKGRLENHFIYACLGQ